MSYFVYIRKNDYNKYYVGHTKDVQARLYEHNRGAVNATKYKLPWKLNWYCQFGDKKKAIAFEKYLKSGSGRAFAKKHL